MIFCDGVLARCYGWTGEGPHSITREKFNGSTSCYGTGIACHPIYRDPKRILWVSAE